MSDASFMREALALAAKARGEVEPNPMVGAVAVRDGRIVARGFHQRYGEAHAEANLITEAAGDLSNATVYLTLEPCTHLDKKTPPCTPQLLAVRPARVVIASIDPNPSVSGRGIAALRDAGIRVDTGLLAEEERQLNQAYYAFRSSQRPYVIAKWAMTLDGKIASRLRDSRWVSSEEARTEVHRLRGAVDAVMVGVWTVLTDDPQLTPRLVRGKPPIRIILDSTLRTPPGARVLEGSNEIPTWILTTAAADPKRRSALERAGAKVLTLDADAEQRVDIHTALRRLRDLKIDRLLVEGGREVFSSLFHQRVVDQVIAYIAPKIIGGTEAPGPVGGIGFDRIGEALALDDVDVRTVGPDLCIRGFLYP
jgi:diaminohydroxyphosphoribosylaminopyrimidine deaminase/5-amino-6-(5-phosphoribosylamino)uracil reductase